MFFLTICEQVVPIPVLCPRDENLETCLRDVEYSIGTLLDGHEEESVCLFGSILNFLDQLSSLDNLQVLHELVLKAMSSAVSINLQDAATVCAKALVKIANCVREKSCNQSNISLFWITALIYQK